MGVMNLEETPLIYLYMHPHSCLRPHLRARSRSLRAHEDWASSMELQEDESLEPTDHFHGEYDGAVGTGTSDSGGPREAHSGGEGREL